MKIALVFTLALIATPASEARKSAGYGSGEASRWIMERRDERDIRLISTRNYVGRQTAIQASWLLFLEPGLANEFLMALGVAHRFAFDRHTSPLCENAVPATV
jgi:hypothetical protein